MQIWIDLEVSNPNWLSQIADLTEESWRRSLDSDKSWRTKEDQINWYIYLFPSRVARFVSRNISPSMDSKVFLWSEWFRSRTNERQRMKTLLGCRRYLECNASIVNLCTYNQIKHTNTSNLPKYNLLIHVSD